MTTPPALLPMGSGPTRRARDTRIPQADEQGSRLIAYRDDGPISKALGRLTRGQLPPLLPVLVATAITAVLLVVAVRAASAHGTDAEEFKVTLFAPLLTLLLAAPSSLNPHSGRVDWLVPPLMRGIEYAYLAVLGFTYGVSKPLVYVLIAVLAYHHYDTVYRTRQRLWPQRWVFWAGLGWEGRMIIAAAAAMFHVLPVAYAALAGYLGLLFGVESVYTWVRAGSGKGVEIDLEGEENGS